MCDLYESRGWLPANGEKCLLHNEMVAQASLHNWLVPYEPTPKHLHTQHKHVRESAPRVSPRGDQSLGVVATMMLRERMIALTPDDVTRTWAPRWAKVPR